MIPLSQIDRLKNYDREVRHMMVKNFLNEYFACSPEMDEDGFYHYLVRSTKGTTVCTALRAAEIDDMDVVDGLILDCDDEDILSLTWLNGDEYFDFQHTEVSKIEKSREEMELPDGTLDFEEYIEIRSDDFPSRALRLTVKPYISVSFAHRYEI